MIQKQHNVSKIVPAFFIKSLVNLEASINTTVQKEKDAKKKMNPSNAKALTAMKQKVKKTIKEHETALMKYHEVSQYSLNDLSFFKKYCYRTQKLSNAIT